MEIQEQQSIQVCTCRPDPWAPPPGFSPTHFRVGCPVHGDGSDFIEEETTNEDEIARLEKLIKPIGELEPEKKKMSDDVRFDTADGWQSSNS